MGGDVTGKVSQAAARCAAAAAGRQSCTIRGCAVLAWEVQALVADVCFTTVLQTGCDTLFVPSCSAAEAVKDAFVAEDLQGPGKGLPSARAKFEAGRRCACYELLLRRGSQPLETRSRLGCQAGSRAALGLQSCLPALFCMLPEGLPHHPLSSPMLPAARR